MTYPEHEKLSKVNHLSQAIGEFLEWCSEDKGYWLAEWEAGGLDAMYPIHRDRIDLLAEYFEIDLKVLEDEKREMLARQRAMNA